ncbi:alpha/beta hydrolase [Sedimenticola sp.]|uniref:alpha/beta hydrolase n=1 Tax=Sedimenticola sp. TaxID=1940285 RepID=UPI003D1527D1
MSTPELSRTLLYLFSTLFGAYLLLLLAIYFNQHKLLYLPHLPSREIATTPQAVGLTYEELELNTADGERLHGWYIPTDNARGTLLFFHGNAGNLSHRLDSLQIFHRLNLNVLIFDYRGYGRSSGQPSENGTQLDARAAWAYLVDERGESPGHIVLFGRSLGASIAARLATEKQPAALILESAFISVPELAAELYRWLPVRFLARLQYRTRDTLSHVHCPVLVAHSPDDEIIPYRHGRVLYETAPPPKAFLRLTGDHNMGFLLSGESYIHGIDAFLATHLPTKR